MGSKINDVINKINNYFDKVYCSPLTAEEVEELENELNIQFPDFFKIFLLRIGIFQDLIRDDIFETKGQYIFEKEFINSIFKSEAIVFFAFGSNGYGDLFLLKDKKFDDEYIYKLNHESGKITKTKGTFIEFVNKAIDKVIKDYRKRKSNNEKKWKIQLSFETNEEQELFEHFRKCNMNQTVDGWELSEKFPSGITEFKKKLLFEDDKIVLKKAEFKGWNKPIYSVDFCISLTDKKKKERIEKIDLFFRNTKNLGYKLVSYGIL